MRIIAGSAKGSQIFAPKGQDTRPTQDRVRESLFNILQGDVFGAMVLDLFAGSGALALEAISRGANHAILVDAVQDAVVCIKRNIAKLGFEGRAHVMKCDWKQAVAQLRGQGAAFDLVFLDPPYRVVETAEILDCLVLSELLTAGALVVVEHRKGCSPTEHSSFAVRSIRAYGDTEISFLEYLWMQKAD